MKQILLSDWAVLFFTLSIGANDVLKQHALQALRHLDRDPLFQIVSSIYEECYFEVYFYQILWVKITVLFNFAYGNLGSFWKTNIINWFG